MSGDIVRLAADATPYVVAAASAYGGTVLAHTQEQAATATIGFGRRLAQRIFGARAEDEEVPEALADVIGDSADTDNQAALRKAIRKALADDEKLEADVARLIKEARETGIQVTATGERSVAVHTNHGTIATGDRNNLPSGSQ
ncbi:hypothetical protein [Actinomadura sp. 7K534]|uniref:hypothetical protein n=1 Tax=Actinomadura sp. 7K534 TaxID=2530366 RepID=UPI001A9EF16A|nr:hypothetical protein [Actinomadura sp. 7K534]